MALDDELDDYEAYEGEDEDPFEEALLDCGMGRDGLCSKAGSEECDFECPFSQ